MNGREARVAFEAAAAYYNLLFSLGTRSASVKRIRQPQSRLIGLLEGIALGQEPAATSYEDRDSSEEKRWAMSMT